MNLSGKRILVTGASGGIGRLVCLKLVQKGAELLLADRPCEPLDKLLAEIGDQGGKATALHTNLLEEGAGEKLAQDAQATGQIDIVINLAGIMSFRLFQNESAENLQRMWQVNVIAPMQLTRACCQRWWHAALGVSSTSALSSAPSPLLVLLPTRPTSSPCAASLKLCAANWMARAWM